MKSGLPWRCLAATLAFAFATPAFGALGEPFVLATETADGSAPTVETWRQGFVLGWIDGEGAHTLPLDATGRGLGSPRLLEGRGQSIGLTAGPAAPIEVVSAGDRLLVAYRFAVFVSSGLGTWTLHGATILDPFCPSRTPQLASEWLASRNVGVAGSEAGWLTAEWRPSFDGEAAHAPLALRRVALDGTVAAPILLPGPDIPTPSGDQTHVPDAVAIGSDGRSFLVVWGGLEVSTKLTHIDANGEITTIAAPPSWRISRDVHVAFNGSAFVVAWSDGAGTIRVSRVAPQGAALDGSGVIVSTGSVVDLEPAGGETLLLSASLGTDGGPAELRGTRLAIDASPLDPAGFAIASGTRGAAAPAGDGAWLVVFDDDQSPLRGRFIGTPLVADSGAPDSALFGPCADAGVATTTDASTAPTDAAVATTSDAMSTPEASVIVEDAGTMPTDSAIETGADSSRNDVRVSPVTHDGCDCSLAQSRADGTRGLLAWLALALVARRRNRYYPRIPGRISPTFDRS